MFPHYRGSEIAPSVPVAREAPDSALIRISTSLPRDDPTHRGGQDEISICSKVKIRGSDRKLKSQEGIIGCQDSSVQSFYGEGKHRSQACGGLSRGAEREVLGQEVSVFEDLLRSRTMCFSWHENPNIDR